jgi:hypothetical protein
MHFPHRFLTNFSFYFSNFSFYFSAYTMKEGRRHGEGGAQEIFDTLLNLMGLHIGNHFSFLTSPISD